MLHLTSRPGPWETSGSADVGLEPGLPLGILTSLRAGGVARGTWIRHEVGLPGK